MFIYIYIYNCYSYFIDCFLCSGLVLLPAPGLLGRRPLLQAVHLMRSDSDARNTIPSRSFSFERKGLIITSAGESLCETPRSSERSYFAMLRVRKTSISPPPRPAAPPPPPPAARPRAGPPPVGGPRCSHFAQCAMSFAWAPVNKHMFVQ